MSFREKTAWIATITTLVVWSYYFVVVWQAVNAGVLNGDGILKLFYVCMGATIGVMLGGCLLAARLGGHDFGAVPDERERAITGRATTIGTVLLEWMVLGVALWGLLKHGWVGTAFPADPLGSMAVIVANGLLFALVLSNVLREIILIVQFRLMD
ncbi:MAG: hypothetical protein ABL879_09720 [Devosia sp.]